MGGGARMRNSKFNEIRQIDQDNWLSLAVISLLSDCYFLP